MGGRSTLNPGGAPRYPHADEQEAALVRRMSLQDRAALAELYAIYHRRLARFLGRFIRQYETVQEIVNDTLFIVWQQAAHFRGNSRVSTWIMGIAYRRALKALRYAATRPSAQAFAGELPAAEGDAIEEAEQRELMARALDTLPL